MTFSFIHFVLHKGPHHKIRKYRRRGVLRNGLRNLWIFPSDQTSRDQYWKLLNKKSNIIWSKCRAVAGNSHAIQPEGRVWLAIHHISSLEAESRQLINHLKSVKKCKNITLSQLQLQHHLNPIQPKLGLTRIWLHYHHHHHHHQHPAPNHQETHHEVVVVDLSLD